MLSKFLICFGILFMALGMYPIFNILIPVILEMLWSDEQSGIGSFGISPETVLFLVLGIVFTIGGLIISRKANQQSKF